MHAKLITGRLKCYRCTVQTHVVIHVLVHSTTEVYGLFRFTTGKPVLSYAAWPGGYNVGGGVNVCKNYADRENNP